MTRFRSSGLATFLAAMVTISAGCHKKDKASSSSSTSSASPSTAPGELPPPPPPPDSLTPDGQTRDPNLGPLGYIPVPPRTDFGEDGSPNLDALSDAFTIYCQWKKEMPGDVNAMVTSKYLKKIPAPPAGKHYAIVSGRVVLQ